MIEETEKQDLVVDQEDVQSYSPEYSRPTLKNQYYGDTSDVRKAPIGDEFDMYEMASAVHSPVSDTITRDFTLSDLDEEVLNAKLPKFIREQIKTIHIAHKYMVVPMEVLRRKYNTEEKAQEVFDELKKIADAMKELLMNEIYTLVIMTRGKGGRVIKAFLRPRVNEGEEEVMEAKSSPNIISRTVNKLTGGSKKK